MAIENKLARLMRNTGPARFFVPVGLILIVFGILMLGFNSDSYLETTGTVTSVVESLDADNQVSNDVYFTYTVEGKTYESVFASLSGSYRKGDAIRVFYDPENPENTTNSKLGGFFAPLLIVLGAAAIGFGVFQTVKAFGKSSRIDAQTGGRGQQADFEGFKQRPGVQEYYFRFDGNALKPGYILEDADRKALFEGEMVRNALVGARTFAFRNHITGSAAEHEVGHTVTNSYNDEFFSVSSWFKFDGENIWDVLHRRGFRMETNLRSRFPRVIYDVTLNGQAFAEIETSSVYVHEEDEAAHSLAIPAGRMYYRVWTASDDLDSLFLLIFAISETEQAVVE